ncbi:MAG TPA: hypothetical protein VNC42_15540 [Bradyrhizobium sp.]|jgi:hypothetical protein|nr:hypothetical protein [Bradyrhizobium sp.]
MPVDLSEAIAVATRFGYLLDFPEHPHKGNAEADNDAQKQQRQAGCCEHAEHPSYEASGVPWTGVKKTASVQNTPRPREFSRLSRSSTLPDRTSFQPSKAAGSAADLDRANVPTGARMHAPLHRVAVAIIVIGIAVGVVIIGVEAEPSKSAKAAVVVKPVVEITATDSATCHGSAVKSSTAKSGSAAKTTGVETASTKTAATKAAAAVEATAATAKAATTVASASAAATSATAGQGDSRCKHANRDSCN